MPRRLIHRYLPEPDKISNLPGLGRFGPRLADPSLWHLNRRSASLAVGWGLFCAVLPIPMQTIPAALGAIYFRCNLPITIVMVWLSNPLTMAPIVLSGYWLGSTVFGQPMLHLAEIKAMLHSAWDYIASDSSAGFPKGYGTALKTLMLGLLMEAIIIGVIGGIVARLLWRWHVVRAWRKRQKQRRMLMPPPDIPESHTDE